MTVLKQILLYFMIFMIVFLFPQVVLGEEPQFDLTARSAILMEAETGEIIYSKNKAKELPPASMTKIMTMLLVMEAIDEGRADLQDIVTVSERAASMGGSQVYLEPGEEMTLEEMMKAIAISSANDASVAVAEHIWGTEKMFIKKMNQRAQELGLKNTYYYNTNGLPPGQKDSKGNTTTAYDLALLTREILKYNHVFEWTSTWIDYLRDGEFVLNNTNKLVRHYAGANGLKTGYTSEAKFCVTSTAERNDLKFIAVIMGASSSQNRFNEAARLLSYGFNMFENFVVYSQGETVKTIDIWNAKNREAEVIVKEDVTVPIRRGESDNIDLKILINSSLKAPLVAGEEAGKIKVYKGNLLIRENKLLLKSDIERTNVIKLIFRITKRLFKKLFNLIF